MRRGAVEGGREGGREGGKEGGKERGREGGEGVGREREEKERNREREEGRGREVQDEEEEELRRRVEQNRLRFPLVCKPLHDDGRASSHELTLIGGPSSLAARRCVCVCVCVCDAVKNSILFPFRYMTYMYTYI